MKSLLRRMLDETEFLSDYGVRALSRAHLEQPYSFRVDGMDLSVRYCPAESESGVFGGNSNWRGPIWFPVNFLIIESLQKFHHYYGDDFRIECPTGSGSSIPSMMLRRSCPGDWLACFLMTGQGVDPYSATNHCCKKTRIFGNTCSSTNTFTATTAAVSGPLIKPGGPH